MFGIYILVVAIELLARNAVGAVGIPLADLALAPTPSKDYWISSGTCDGRKAAASVVEVCVPMYTSDTTNSGIIGQVVGSLMVELLDKVYDKDGNIVSFSSSAQYFFPTADCSGTATEATAGPWNGLKSQSCGSSTLGTDKFIELSAHPKGTALEFPGEGAAVVGFVDNKCGGGAALWYWYAADKCFHLEKPASNLMSVYFGHCTDNLEFFVYNYSEDKCQGKMTKLVDLDMYISGSATCTVNDWSSPAVSITNDLSYEVMGYGQCITGPKTKPCPAPKPGKDKPSVPKKKSLREANEDV